MAAIEKKIDQAALAGIGQTVLGEFQDLANRRVPLEDSLIKDHRQYLSQYTPEEMREIKGVKDNACQLYVGITRTKIRTLDARINDMAFGSGTKNWAVEPTPVPMISPALFAKQMAAYQADRQAHPDMPEKSPSEIRMEAARLAAELMELQMQDHLEEAQYYRMFRRVTHHGHKYGMGTLKGPLVDYKWAKKWQLVPGADPSVPPTWKMDKQREIRPYFEVVSPFDSYLEWTANTPQDSDVFGQRHLFRASRLAQLARSPGFLGGAITDWINECPTGDNKWENWENQLYLSGREKPLQNASRLRFEVVEWWGALKADQLLQLGLEEQLAKFGITLDEAVASQIRCHLWLRRSTGAVLGYNLNPNEDESNPYSFYVPMPEDGSVVGTSGPGLMRDPQKSINATERMLHDNAAGSVLPQVQLTVSRLISPGDLKRMVPGRVWPVNEEPWNSANPAIQFSDFPNHTATFLSMWNHRKVALDEVSGIPSYQYGQGSPGVGRTVGGLNMLMGAAGLLAKDQLRAWDEFQTDVLMKLFNFEMQYSPRDEIKGDFNIKVTTTVSMLQSGELAKQIREFRMSTANPADLPFTKRRPMIMAEAKALDLPAIEFVKTKEEMDQEIKIQREQAAREKAAMEPKSQLAFFIEMKDKAADTIGKLAKAAKDLADAGATGAEQFQEELQVLNEMAGWLDQQIQSLAPPQEQAGPAGPGAGGGVEPQPGLTPPGDTPPEPVQEGAGYPAPPIPAADGGVVEPNMDRHLAERLRLTYPEVFRGN